VSIKPCGLPGSRRRVNFELVHKIQSVNVDIMKLARQCVCANFPEERGDGRRLNVGRVRIGLPERLVYSFETTACHDLVEE
jgi:hypothetical protein